MQQALEALDVVKLQYTQNRHINDAITAIKAALEQPEQEPVAFYHPRNGFYWAKLTSIFAPTAVDVPPVPLYVKWKAAQRPWVGLTEKDWEYVKDSKGTSLDTFDHGAAWAADQLMKRNT